MRFAGRISDWNDERGYGFVVPNGGGERAFVHVKEFHRGSRRPVDGDLISYLPETDSRGRLQAREIKHSGRKIQPQRQASRAPRAAIGIGVLASVIGIGVIGVIPAAMAVGYLALSVASYVMYFLDKTAAKKDARRIPEKNLHVVDLLGGWPGALIAQQQFRHKTIKQPFQFIFWTTVVVNLVGAWWLVSSGEAFRLAQSLGR